MTTETRFKTHYPESWKNAIASDLNELLIHARYCYETSNDASDQRFIGAVLRIAQRVAEFEELETRQAVTKESVTKLHKALHRE